MAKEISTEKYEGPGRAASAIGDTILYDVGGGIVGAAGGALVAAFTLKPDSERVLAVAESMKNIGAPISGKAGAVLIAASVTGAIVGGLAAVFGLVHGFLKAGRGKKQFEQMKAERVQAQEKLGALQSQVDELTTEVKTTRKFAETITSRAAQGSAADAALADKAHAAEQRRAI